MHSGETKLFTFLPASILFFLLLYCNYGKIRNLRGRFLINPAPSWISRLSRMVLAAGMAACQLYGQEQRATLRGTVLDPARAPIAGARITAVSDENSVTATAVSDASGDFSIGLPSGTTVKIEAGGFAVYTQRFAAIDANDEIHEFMV